MDFTLSTAFEGFEQTTTGTSVLLTCVSNLFAGVATGFTEASLMSRGMKLVSSEEQTRNGLPAHFSRVIQQAYGTRFSKWALAFGAYEYAPPAPLLVPSNRDGI